MRVTLRFGSLDIPTTRSAIGVGRAGSSRQGGGSGGAQAHARNRASKTARARTNNKQHAHHVAMLRIADRPQNWRVNRRRFDCPSLKSGVSPTGVMLMSKSQLFDLMDMFDQGLTFAEAICSMGYMTADQEDDAGYTWRRWCREQDMWGFYSA
jgi:hypothetical protein